ncbi:HEPN domain-containing protein [Arundinibacter roseus]|uniref:HEPN domain-containing protein n=1 Tax=Arundinibacter roseus TaxID=2070510 RepID=A0A4R4K8A6_9BACT|nr:HEPN domain-containing protein [Arundinibacter roseus]TDB63603.1 HEPN domain-containing protein [Arundinibacter roseus]
MKEQDRVQLSIYRIKRARETFNEVAILLENGLWNTAVNRLYYACYYAVIALLIRHEINVNTHAGVRQMFGLHFVKTGFIDSELGRFYSSIFTMRQSADYEDYLDYSKEDVLDLLESANELIKRIEELLE